MHASSSTNCSRHFTDFSEFKVSDYYSVGITEDNADDKKNIFNRNPLIWNSMFLFIQRCAVKSLKNVIAMKRYGQTCILFSIMSL